MKPNLTSPGFVENMDKSALEKARLENTLLKGEVLKDIVLLSHHTLYLSRQYLFIITGVILLQFVALSHAMAEGEMPDSDTSANISLSTTVPSAQSPDTQSASAQPTATRSAETHEQLLDIITSSNFAEAEEKKKWVEIKKPREENPSWLAELFEKIIEFLFSNDSNEKGSDLSWLPALIKLLLILALIVFIVWVLRKASVQAWFATLRNPMSRRPSVSTFEPSILPQSWESLPTHDKIPQAVQQLINNNQTEEATSMLYRGSLRWLNQTQKLSIIPATTEKQCLKQIAYISSLSTGSTKQYLTQVINVWLQVAYAPVAYGLGKNTDLDSKNENQSSINNVSTMTALKEQLSGLTQGWLRNLPINNNIQASINSKPNDEQGNSKSTLSDNTLNDKGVINDTSK